MRPRVLGMSALALVVTGAGCDVVLGIHSASDQDWDGGSGAAATAAPGPTSAGTSSGNASTASTAPASTPDASSAPLPTDAGTTLHAWATWPMPNPPSTGLPNPQSYDAGVTGVIFDNVTGLTWEQAVPTGAFTWDSARGYCATLALAGGGWRLPSRVELLSIVDFTQVPTIDGTHFPNTPMDAFWSGSLLAGNAAYAWTVNFGFTVTPSANNPLNTECQVRCVR